MEELGYPRSVYSTQSQVLPGLDTEIPESASMEAETSPAEETPVPTFASFNPEGSFSLGDPASSANQATHTPHPKPTHRPTKTPRETPTPTATETFLPTATATATLTPEDTPTPTASPTELPTFTPTLLPTPTEAPLEPVTIRYTYDSLHRLVSADYSTGLQFAYIYDPAGNVLEYRKVIGGDDLTTAYTYDEASQLSTAQTGTEAIWHYTYDNNGNLIQSIPGDSPAAGARRYTYNAAGFLVRVEAFDGDWQAQAEMAYNALGQRLQMTSSGMIVQYVTEDNRPLVATSNGNNVFYLYGRDPIGKWDTAWNFFLPDGTGTARQIADANGLVTFSASYSPWGETLESFGEGNLPLGYFNGLADAATGLLYVGNGQYYDPATGRFLTRGVRPDSPNPYVPWNGDLSGAFLAPLGLLALAARGKRRRGKWIVLAALIVLGLSVSLALTACGSGTPPAPTEPPPPAPSQTPPPQDGGDAGNTGYGDSSVALAPVAVPSIAITCTSVPDSASDPTPTPTSGQTLLYLGEWKITHYNYALESDSQFPANDKVPVSGLDPSRAYRRQFIYSQPGIYGQGTGKAESGEYITIDHWRNLQEYGPGWESTNPAYWYFTYGRGGKFKEGTPWASVAMAQTELHLRYGDKVKIGLYPERIFEVTDTGTFPDTSHLDVFIGEETHANALAYGTKFNIPVWKVVD